MKVMDNFCDVWSLLNNNANLIHEGIYHEWDISIWNSDPREYSLVFYDSNYDIIGQYQMSDVNRILTAKFPDVFALSA